MKYLRVKIIIIYLYLNSLFFIFYDETTFDGFDLRWSIYNYYFNDIIIVIYRTWDRINSEVFVLYALHSKSIIENLNETSTHY